MKLEIQILVLFVLTIVALVIHHFVPREMEVDLHGDQWAFANSYARSHSRIRRSLIAVQKQR